MTCRFHRRSGRAGSCASSRTTGGSARPRTRSAPVPKYGDAANSAAMAEIVSHHDHYAALDSAAAPPIPARTADQYADVRYVQGYAAALLWEMGMRAAIMAGHRNPIGTDL